MAARREVVRQLQALGLSERQALKLVSMSPSTLRYLPRDASHRAERLLGHQEAVLGQVGDHGVVPATTPAS